MVALAVGTILSWRPANNLLRHAASLFAHTFIVAGAVGFVVVLFSAPLLVFSGRLVREWQRGVFAYCAFASDIGARFQRKSFRPGAPANDDNLSAPDFSATIDLYQVVSNVSDALCACRPNEHHIADRRNVATFCPGPAIGNADGDIISAVKSLLF